MENEPQPVPQHSWLTKKRGIRDIWFWVFVILLLVFGFEVWLIFRLAFVATVVGSSSMEPTIQKGDVVLVGRINFFKTPLKRGDIVFLRDPVTKREWLVKRVIGLPGELLFLQAGRIYINGVPLQDPYAKNEFTDEYGVWQIPNNAVFVMGDNRSHSNDSRDFGPVPLELIEGKVLFRYFPISRFGRIGN